jgi:probable HAF family extracellular repeat protein
MRNAIRLIALTIIAVLKAKLTLAVFCLLLGASARAQGLQDGKKRSTEVFTVTDLGPNVWPVAVNATGQVAASGLCPTCGPNQQALLWSATTGLKDLGGITNNFLGASAAFGLNGLGEVVGTSNSPFSPVPCCHAFLWSSSGKIQDLGTLPGCAATGIGINDRGEVAGISSPNTYPGNASNCHPFLWNSTNGMQDLGLPPGATVAGVGGINNAGVIAGGYISASDFSPRSYIWTSRDGFRDLGIPQSEAAGISNTSHVVGRYNACIFCGNGRAFLWEPKHGMRDLGTLPGQAYSYGWAVNVYDQVVGFSGPYAFLWTKATGMLNLNDLIDKSSGWQLYFATGINVKGQITGRGTINGVEHGYKLIPKIKRDEAEDSEKSEEKE